MWSRVERVSGDTGNDGNDCCATCTVDLLRGSATPYDSARRWESPDSWIRIVPCLPAGCPAVARVGTTPHSQWRDRAGFAPASSSPSHELRFNIPAPHDPVKIDRPGVTDVASINTDSHVHRCIRACPFVRAPAAMCAFGRTDLCGPGSSAAVAWDHGRTGQFAVPVNLRQADSAMAARGSSRLSSS